MKLGVPFWLFEKFVLKRRAQVLARFLQAMKPSNADTCLEIGGPTNGLSAITGEFKQYLVINMDSEYLKKNYAYYSGPYQPIAADGRHLPFENNSIDFIFANALLEHIPREHRYLIAGEIKRVCRKGYFLANGNHWFPLDPHYMLPFYQFLPHNFKKFVSRHVGFKWFPKGTYDAIDLVTTKEYKELFPGAHYEGLRFVAINPIPETILVWQRNG